MRHLLLTLLLATTLHAAEKPNIVILYADDMGYGDLGANNPESKIPTPHLDQLAAQGMRFTDAHSSSGICSPSRFALLTGRYHWRRFHDIVNSWGPSVFRADDLTLPGMLQSQGYQTACIGKWHLGWDWDALRRPDAEMIGEGKARTWPAAAFDWSRPIPDGPTAHGFDYYFGDDVPNFPPYAWIEIDRVTQAPTLPFEVITPTTEGSPESRPGPMVAGWRQDAVMPELTRRAVRWIADQAGRKTPFFLYFPWTSPHAPIVPTAEWQGRTQAGGFGDFMAQSDACAGEVLQALADHGLTENTVVIFTADNGPEHYAYERVRQHQHRSMGPLRGLKRDIYDGGHRVPMVVRWPGHVPAGRVSDGLIGQIDILPTLAAITGFEIPASSPLDGVNQLPLWLGQAPSARHHHVHNTYDKGWAIRSGEWTLVDAPTGYRSKHPAWFDEANGYGQEPAFGLYRMTDDPSQHHNLANDHPEKVTELRSLLKAIREEN
ncbi:MAG: arylsulfatase [Verrucomicrobiales bacterium]|nr:arylsulfatase [Verrucomicrobiales bacterium]